LSFSSVPAGPSFLQFKPSMSPFPFFLPIPGPSPI
jgi:hypothetical protein